jgi:hypothetical protein
VVLDADLDRTALARLVDRNLFFQRQPRAAEPNKHTNTQTHKHPTSAKHGSLAFPFADALGVATVADSVRCALGLSPQVRQAPQ